jgi:hypothetical protein
MMHFDSTFAEDGFTLALGAEEGAIVLLRVSRHNFFSVAISDGSNHIKSIVFFGKVRVSA